MSENVHCHVVPPDHREKIYPTNPITSLSPVLVLSLSLSLSLCYWKNRVVPNRMISGVLVSTHRAMRVGVVCDVHLARDKAFVV